MNLYLLTLSVLCICSFCTNPAQVTPEKVESMRKSIASTFASNTLPGHAQQILQHVDHASQALQQIGLEPNVENQSLYWREFQNVFMEFRADSQMKLEKIVPVALEYDASNLIRVLPVEVWTVILKILALDDMKSASMACKFFHAILYKHCRFYFAYEARQKQFSESALTGKAYSKGLKKFGYFDIVIKVKIALVQTLDFLCPQSLGECFSRFRRQFLEFDSPILLERITDPFSLMSFGLLEGNGECEQHALYLIKNCVLESVRNVGNYSPSKLKMFASDKHMTLKGMTVLCHVADELIDEPNLAANVIRNFLYEYYTFLVWNLQAQPLKELFSPLHPRVFVLISRLPEQFIFKELDNLILCFSIAFRINITFALISGCCRTDLISKTMREQFISHLIGQTFDLADADLPAKFARYQVSLNVFQFGSHHIPNLIPSIFISELVKLSRGFFGITNYIAFVVTIDMLEEFLRAEGPIYDYDEMFYKCMDFLRYECIPVQLKWAVFKIVNNLIESKNERILDLFMTILEFSIGNTDPEVRRIVGEFSGNVFLMYPRLKCALRHKIVAF